MRHKGLAFFLTGVLVSLAAGWVAFPLALYERLPQPLQFSHRVHMGDKGGMKCEDCHSLRDDGTFTGIPKVEKCAGCHAAPLGDTAAEKTLVEKYVTPNREIPWHVYARQPDNVHFPHAYHLKNAGLTCEQCHGGHGNTETLRPFERNRISGYSRDIWGRPLTRISFTRQGGMKMDDCSRCHKQRGVEESCFACHK